MSNSSGDTTLSIQFSVRPSAFSFPQPSVFSSTVSIWFFSFRFVFSSQQTIFYGGREWAILNLPFLYFHFLPGDFQNLISKVDCNKLWVTVCPPALYFHSEYIIEMTRQTTKLINLVCQVLPSWLLC